jgi:hypothetical protein
VDEPPSVPDVQDRPNPAAKPAPTPSRALKRDEPEGEDDEEEASGPLIAIIGGAAAAVILALVGGLVYIFGPWKSEQPQRGRAVRQQIETKIAAQPPGLTSPPQGVPPQPLPFGPRPMNNVANVQGSPAGFPPGGPGTLTPGPVLAGGPGAPSPGPLMATGPGGLPTQPRPGGLPPFPGYQPIPRPGQAQPVAQVRAMDPTATADDPIRRAQDATVYLNVQVGHLRGSGTGFVIRADGDTVLIVTNDHVVKPT